MARKALVEFLAREALLLGGGDDAPLVDQGGGAVMIECGYAEQAHRSQARLRPIMM